jgi:hypothetical protein
MKYIYIFFILIIIFLSCTICSYNSESFTNNEFLLNKQKLFTDYGINVDTLTDLLINNMDDYRVVDTMLTRVNELNNNDLFLLEENDKTLMEKLNKFFNDNVTNKLKDLEEYNKKFITNIYITQVLRNLLDKEIYYPVSEENKKRIIDTIENSNYIGDINDKKKLIKKMQDSKNNIDFYIFDITNLGNRIDQNKKNKKMRYEFFLQYESEKELQFMGKLHLINHLLNNIDKKKLTITKNDFIKVSNKNKNKLTDNIFDINIRNRKKFLKKKKISLTNYLFGKIIKNNNYNNIISSHIIKRFKELQQKKRHKTLTKAEKEVFKRKNLIKLITFVRLLRTITNNPTPDPDSRGKIMQLIFSNEVEKSLNTLLLN